MTLEDLPAKAMAIVGASLSLDDIQSLRLVNRAVCLLATACITTVTIPEGTDITVFKKVMERFKEIPLLSVVISFRDLLLTEGLLPKLQNINVIFKGSTDAERTEVVKTLRGASRLASARLRDVSEEEALRMIVNCMPLERLYIG